MQSSSVAGNDSSCSDNEDDRSSPASSSYFVASGAEEDTSTSATGCHLPQLVSSDERRQKEQQIVDVRPTHHQEDDSVAVRTSSLLGMPPASSCIGSGNRTSTTRKSVSAGAEDKLCRPMMSMLMSSKIGETGHSSRSDVELLCRLFPHVPPVTLECVLLSYAGNVVQCIEQLLKFHQLKPSVDAPPLPVGANFAAAAAAYAGLPPVQLPTYNHHHQRYVASSNVETPLTFPGGGGGKLPTAGALSLLPATPFNGSDTLQQICGPGGSNPAQRNLPLGFPYPPAALLPTIAGLRYNYSAMMAAAAMAHASSSTTATGNSALTKSATGTTSLPYGLFAAGIYKGTSTDSDK